MIELVYAKFGNAVEIDGSNVMSANPKHHKIYLDEQGDFLVISKRTNQETYVGKTNVSQWRKTVANEIKSKPKSKS